MPWGLIHPSAKAINNKINKVIDKAIRQVSDLATRSESFLPFSFTRKTKPLPRQYKITTKNMMIINLNNISPSYKYRFPLFSLFGNEYDFTMKLLTIITLILLTSFLLLGNKIYKIVANDNSRYNTSLSIKDMSQAMHKPFKVKLQYMLPQRLLTQLAGALGNCRWPWLKNYLIRYFIGRFDVDMHSAIIENPYDYPNFNSFFTRQLKPEARPIAEGKESIACPVDGSISQIGNIHENRIIQAKGFDYSLISLLGGNEQLAHLFENGKFATLYLSPKDYHRVHMPFDGKLRETLFIPGRLFSVNTETTENVPQLFAKNERLVCIFDTELGPMAVILVGAMLVGSIETVWHAKTDTNKITRETYASSLKLAKGQELGLFKMGSTVILLFANNKISWLDTLVANSSVRMGQLMGENEKG